jgi:glycyl-tRNA synthetase beta chain
MPDYLLEIGTEELPAGFIPDAQRTLIQLIGEALRTAALEHKEIRSLSTPRRLTVIVTGLASGQETVHIRKKGPPTEKSFDASGNPLPAATGFAKTNKLKVEELEREKINGVEYLIAPVTIEGKPASEVLSEIVPKAILQLSGERLMRWGSYDIKFSRPIRWIVSLLGSEIVPINLEGVVCGRESYGHRILSKAPVQIKDVSSYASQLKDVFVIVDPDERKRIIEEQVTAIARSKGGEPKQLAGSLLEEVVNITEWPHAIAGDFESEYLQLPGTLIETVMIHHQRYFPVENKKAAVSQRVNRNDLLPCFITVSNNDRKEAEPIIKQGNERVLRARLADGRFFYFDDQKTKLSDRTEALKQLTFQEGLGSYSDKVERLIELAAKLSQQLNLEPRLAVCLEQTAKLSKLDLVTNLVRELPELQGHVGAWYAEQEGQPPDVVTAMASHYSPRSTEDSIPQDTVGMFASVIDKVDNLVSLFALGKKPSGSSDPYALRRQAQGLIDILLDGLTAYPVDLTKLINHLLDRLEPALKPRKQGFHREKIGADLHEFLLQRLKGKLLDAGAGREVVDAVLSARDPFTNLPDVSVRCTCLENLFGSPGGLDAVRAGVRVGKILGADSPDEVDTSLFTLDAERKLWDTFNQQVVKPWQNGHPFRLPTNKQEYEQILNLLRPLSPAVDDFFDHVMVNDEDRSKRNNRHAMLKQIDRYFTSVACFPKLQSLLL